MDGGVMSEYGHADLVDAMGLGDYTVVPSDWLQEHMAESKRLRAQVEELRTQLAELRRARATLVPLYLTPGIEQSAVSRVYELGDENERLRAQIAAYQEAFRAGGVEAVAELFRRRTGECGGAA